MQKPVCVHKGSQVISCKHDEGIEGELRTASNNNRFLGFWRQDPL